MPIKEVPTEQEVVREDGASQLACHFRAWSLTQWLLFGLLLLAVMYTLYFAQSVLMPVAVAVVLAFLLNPLVRKLSGLGFPDWVSSAIVLIVALVALFSAAYSLSGPASTWIAAAPENLRVVEYKLRNMRGGTMENFDEATEQLRKIASLEDDSESVAPVIEVREREPGMAGFVLGWTGSVLVGAMVVIVLAYFLLASRERTRRTVMGLASDFSGRRGVVEMSQEIEQSVSLYLLTVTVINVGLGVAIGATMWLLGLPNPVLWGAMAALLNYAPYIGPAVGSIVVGLVALVTFDSVWYATLPPLCYLAWNTLEGQFLTPAIVGRWMKLTPLGVLMSIIFWGFLWGPAGILLAVPLLTIGLIAFRHIRDFVPPPDETEEAVPVETETEQSVDREPALA